MVPRLCTSNLKTPHPTRASKASSQLLVNTGPGFVKEREDTQLVAHVARTGPCLYSLVAYDDSPLTSILDDRYSLSEGHLKEERGVSLL